MLGSGIRKWVINLAVFESQTEPDANGESYGDDLCLGKVADVHPVRNGELGDGYGAIVERYPESRLTIVVLRNRSYPLEELGPVVSKNVLGVK